MPVHPHDEQLIHRALRERFGERAADESGVRAGPSIDFAAFAAWLDPHSSYRKKVAGSSSQLGAHVYGQGSACTNPASAAAFGSSARRWGPGGLTARPLREAEPSALVPSREALVPSSPPPGQLTLEVHHFVPCQKLQRDGAVEWLQVQTDFLRLCYPPISTPSARKEPGKPVLWATQQLITITPGSEGWNELGAVLASGIPHEAELGLQLVETSRGLHVGTAVLNLADLLRSGADVKHAELPV